MNIARPLKTGLVEGFGIVATANTRSGFNRRYATRAGNDLIPALKRRATVMPTLRVEELFQTHSVISELVT
jgi:hypothetical protein